MGTNYYLQEKPDCAHCGRPYERLHIGKSSAGWCFALRVHPEIGINGIDDWVARWSIDASSIWDEYGEEISCADMLSKITIREWGPNGAIKNPVWLSRNHAEIGPNGLARHAIDQRFCIGHGDGTYDLMLGEFS